jgi:putative oxidoreductase
MKVGLTVLRVALGATFFAHGAQKMFGWFGGPGLENMAKGLDSMGVKPGKRNATIAAVAEVGGGTLFTLGLATPVAAAGTIGVMNQAVRSVHLSKGFFNTNGGYEFNLVLVAGAVALADLGPGEFSLEQALGLKLYGPLWALAALAAGLTGPQLLERALPGPEAETADSRFVPEPVQETAAV